MSEAARSPAIEQYRQAFEVLRPALGGMPERRDAAFARFAELGFPGPREEAWKYTSLRRLESRRFAPAAREVALAATVELPPALGEHRIVLVNGHLRADLAVACAAPGLAIRSLATGHVDDNVAAAVLRWPQGGGTERFAALNAAMCPDPLLIEVAAETRIDAVLHVVMLTTGSTSTMSYPRLTFRLGAHSRLRVVLHHVGESAAEQFVAAVVEAQLAEGAELHAYRVQANGDRVFHIERIDGVVGPGARLALRDAQLGGTLSRLDLNVSLAGRAAETELTGLFVADGTRHLDTHVHVDHRAIATRSVQDYRGVAAGRGRAVFNGKAVVHEGAQQSNARQSSRNLLLTPGAEIDTKPELEIYADDVQCSHGATTGQLDPAAMFYLRSRGLSENEARSALTRAFAGAVLSRIDHAPVARLVHDELDGRLVRLLEQQP
ncbi:MAG TPA: Fe-S cluster assembly protein SufD [Steroidobacteraceae bacterium]